MTSGSQTNQDGVLGIWTCSSMRLRNESTDEFTELGKHPTYFRLYFYYYLWFLHVLSAILKLGSSDWNMRLYFHFVLYKLIYSLIYWRCFSLQTSINLHTTFISLQNLFHHPELIFNLAISRSPLNQVDQMLGKTLIFVGDEDTTVVPESQGISLYKALHHRNVTTALYHYPGNHDLNIFYLFFKWPNLASFCLFSLFSHSNSNDKYTIWTI